ncbi:MAG TPA: hypothetical protein ENN69_05380, partial [Spirochaetia bacterium]|nr:hypothetical protein [Spirochaetia bacterium]
MAEPASAEKKIAFSVKDFASQFQKATTLSHKRHIVDRLFEVHPDIKPLVPVHVLEGWTDRRAGLELIAAARAPLSFFDRIAFSRQLAAVESGIRKTVRGAVRMILSPERKGRKFPEILFGKLAPFMRRNDQMVAEKILAALHGLSPRHPVKRLYGSLIRNVHKALAIDREVKKEGIREETIRRVVTQHGESLSHRGMREAVQNLFFLDPRYADFHKLLKEVLGNILHDESFTGPVPTADESTAALLRELAGVRDLESFVWKAAGMKEAGGEYAAEVERLFDLLLHEPLVNIYKLIKFPLNAELFHRWLREGPIPSGLSDELERKIAAVKADREKGVGRSVSGTDYADFARLYYTLDIGFTDKYKLVADTASSGADPAAGRFVMDQIKNVQFKIEQKFIGVLVKELSVRRSFSEIDEFLELVRKKLDLRIADYATAFKKNIEALAHKNQGVTDRYTPLFSLLKYIAEGKMVSVDALLALDAKVNPDRNLMFIARLASSLVDFYFLHNSRLILRYMKEYLAGLAATDGVALKKRMSTVTREEIYGV